MAELVVKSKGYFIDQPRKDSMRQLHFVSLSNAIVLVNVSRNTNVIKLYTLNLNPVSMSLQMVLLFGERGHCVNETMANSC